MKHRVSRRFLAALGAGALLTGAAVALGQGDSLITLSYLNETYIPAIVAQGEQVHEQMLTEAYQTAADELKQINEQGSGQRGLYSEDSRARGFARGDQVSFSTGAGFLLISGQADITFEGTVIDVTEGAEISDGEKLRVGHRYLVGEETKATVTITSGLASAGVQGGYAWVQSGEKSAPFTDVSSADWYCSAVDYAYFNGLFSGMGDDTFAPSSNMDRAMMMTVLYHLAGSPEEERLAAVETFSDVTSDKWYFTFVNWAAAQGVSAGTGDGMFSPTQQVTREQVVVLLYNFATNYMGMTLPERADITICADYDKVAFWSQDAISWAVAGGIMGADNGGKLEPGRSASRAEVAYMLMSFSQRYLDS